MIQPGFIRFGTTVYVNIAYLDDNGAPADPATVVFKTLSPSGLRRTYTYQTDTELARSSTGNYEVTLVPDEAGRWYVRWEATVPTSAVEDDFIVQDSKFNQAIFSGDYV